MSLATLLEGWVTSQQTRTAEAVIVQGISLDSRKVKPGDAFVAVAGEASHGLRFAMEAQARGAVAIVHDGLAPMADVQIPCILVAGLAKQLSALGARFFHAPSDRLVVAGVTGTNGKTSTAHFIAQGWQRVSGNAGLIGTIGYGAMNRLQPADLTTPDPISVQRMLSECIDSGVENVAMEVSSHALDQGRVADVAFQAAVFTNLTRDHLDYHGSMARYAAAKRRLFTDCQPRFAIINRDDEFGRQLIGELGSSCEVLSYGINGNAELAAKVVQMDSSGMNLEISSPWGGGRLRSGLLGRFNVSNLLAAAGSLALLGMPWNKVTQQLELMQPVPGRMHCLGGEGGLPLVVVDFAHTPDALRQALEALQSHLHGRLTCVFGCGGDRDRGKRAMMAAVAESLSDKVILTNDNPRSEAPEAIFADMLAGMQSPEKAMVMADRAAAIRLAIEGSRNGDIVLVAGKGHETYQELHGNRLPFSDVAAVQAVLEQAA
ncbi:MAG: UDP-N-acetylmuramoyl-L-alanyl-D-glutamate--2,6-diaminopimelate ligase [Xanthomonadales bacterium]|nr:UDP-N-acetylmuramoyl-L-alanyl-D-glutamate--2,6-diaminopimelate ligase [Xanthomonadales bacterium]